MSFRHSAMSHFCVIMNVPTPTHSYAECHSSFYQFGAEKHSLFYFPITFQSDSFNIVAGETEKKMLKKCSRKANFKSGILTAQVTTLVCMCMLWNDCSSEIICPLCVLQIFKTAVCLNVPGNKKLHTTLVKFVDA